MVFGWRTERVAQFGLVVRVHNFANSLQHIKIFLHLNEHEACD